MQIKTKLFFQKNDKPTTCVSFQTGNNFEEMLRVCIILISICHCHPKPVGNGPPKPTDTPIQNCFVDTYHTHCNW